MIFINGIKRFNNSKKNAGGFLCDSKEYAQWVIRESKEDSKERSACSVLNQGIYYGVEVRIDFDVLFVLEERKTNGINIYLLIAPLPNRWKE